MILLKSKKNVSIIEAFETGIYYKTLSSFFIPKLSLHIMPEYHLFEFKDSKDYFWWKTKKGISYNLKKEIICRNRNLVSVYECLPIMDNDMVIAYVATPYILEQIANGIRTPLIIEDDEFPYFIAYKGVKPHKVYMNKELFSAFKTKKSHIISISKLIKQS